MAPATLFLLPIIACGEHGKPPPPTGSIVGQVSIEGMGIDGVSVSLGNGASTATAGGGNYRFDTVEQGSHMVTISGYPSDARFDTTSAAAGVGGIGGTATVDFRGARLRTASIMGMATAEDAGLGGVAVRLVKPQGTDLYTAAGNGSTSIANERATDVLTHALTTAGLPPAPGSEPAIPSWDYHTSTATVGVADFVLLYKDGEIAGRVVDLSEQDGHTRSVVELHQCKTFTPFDDAGTPTDGTDDRAANCTEYTGVVEEAAVDSMGSWSKGDLREGVYEVVVDLPAGYRHVNKSGAAESDADLTAVPVVPESYFTHQFAELVGRRAAALTETFYIQDRSAGSGTAFVVPEIAGDAVAPPPLDRWDNRNGRCDLGDTPSRIGRCRWAEARRGRTPADSRPAAGAALPAAARGGRNSRRTGGRAPGPRGRGAPMRLSAPSRGMARRSTAALAGVLRPGPLVQFHMPDRSPPRALPGPRRSGHGRGLRAQGRGRVPGRGRPPEGGRMMRRGDGPSAAAGFTEPFFQGGVGLTFYATWGVLPPALDPLSIALVWTRRRHRTALSAQGAASLTHTFLAN